MSLCWDMNEFEVEKLDSRDPLDDSCTWLYVRVSKHAAYVLCIYFDLKVSKANNVHPESMQHLEQSIELNF